MVVLGEEHAAVDDEQPALGLEDGHVPTDLAEPAQCDDPEAVAGQGRRIGQLGVGMAHRVPVGRVRGEASWLSQLGGRAGQATVSRAERTTCRCSGVASTSGSRTMADSMTPCSARAALAMMAPCVTFMTASTTA